MKKSYKQEKDEFYFYLHQILAYKPILNRIFYYLKRSLILLKPNHEYSICIEATKLFIICFYVAVGIFCGSVFLLQNGLFQILYVIGAVVLFIRHFIFLYLEQEEIKLLKQFQKFIGLLRHNYHKSKMLEEALEESIVKADFEISLHMECIYSLLRREEESVKEYQRTAPNRLFVSFYALCFVILKYGDTESKQYSAFLNNLEQLKEEIYIELLKREKLRHKFSGLVLIVLLPILFMNTIRVWALWSVPELYQYYNSVYGVMVRVLVLVSTVLAYEMIALLRGENQYREPEYVILNKVSEIKWIDKLLDIAILWSGKKVRAWYSRIQPFSKHLTIRIFLLQRCLSSFLGMFCYIYLLLCFDLQDSQIPFYVLLAVLGVLLASYFPWIIISFKSLFQKEAKALEIANMQYIVLVLYPVKSMEVQILLEWMELFSDYYRLSMESCVDDYSNLGEAALENLIEKEPDSELVKIVDAVSLCEQIGVERAFEGLESDRKYLLEKRKQDNEMHLSNREVLAKCLTYLPLILLIGLYLIVPFVLESISQLKEYILQFEAAMQ
ncbi:hypothetical protein [Anaeromicropila populeti]|uniref:Uncharacterized protein n=1 Tax=Anaeromicropila populeti TaxID=37658 RepID=A0A1I6JDB1_9FIRM|nr:hypothetical protein [Anaeromicropila populeti]SFR76951.1 hypothetical protein SAMN05661086_01585 [Anaeromicropila populeti]